MEAPPELTQPPPRSDDAVRRICVAQRKAFAFFGVVAVAAPVLLGLGAWSRHPVPLVVGALTLLVALRFGMSVAQTNRRATRIARDGLPAVARLVSRGTNGPLSWLDFDLDTGSGTHRDARLLMSTSSLPALPSGAELRVLHHPDEPHSVYAWIGDRGFQWLLAMPAGTPLPEMPNAKR